MADVDLLAAAFSALLGVEVVSPTKAVALGQPDMPAYSIHQLFRATHIPVCADNHIVIQRLTGENFILPITEGHTIAQVKAAIHAQKGIHPGEQWLLHEKQTLEDKHVLQERGVCTNSVIMCFAAPPGPGSITSKPSIPMIKLHDPDRDLDPRYNYDFTNQKDDGKTYTRGKYPGTAGSGRAGKPIPYHRPYGWKRYALKVLGRPEYGGDGWLGPDGIRTETDNLEWPVSYHGTQDQCVPDIVQNEEGEGLHPGSTNAYGIGVYSSPFMKTPSGESYAVPFNHEGKWYQVVLQNRLITKGCRIYRPGDSGCPKSNERISDECHLVIIVFDDGNEYILHYSPQ